MSEIVLYTPPSPPCHLKCFDRFKKPSKPLIITAIVLALLSMLSGLLISSGVFHITSYDLFLGSGFIIPGAIFAGICWAELEGLRRDTNKVVDDIFDKRNFSSKQEACKYLNIPLEKQNDLEFIKTQYEKSVSLLENKKQKLPPFWTPPIEKEIGNFTRAYQFLTRSPP